MCMYIGSKLSKLPNPIQYGCNWCLEKIVYMRTKPKRTPITYKDFLETKDSSAAYNLCMCIGRILCRLEHPVEYRFLAGLREEFSYMRLKAKCTPILYEELLEILYDYGLTIDDPQDKHEPRHHMEFKKNYRVKGKYFKNFEIKNSSDDSSRLIIKKLAVCIEGRELNNLPQFRAEFGANPIYAHRKDSINFCLRYQNEKNAEHETHKSYGAYNIYYIHKAHNVEINFEHCIFLEAGNDIIAYPGRKDTPAALSIVKNEIHSISFSNCHFRATALDIKQYTYGNIHKGYGFSRHYLYSSCMIRNSKFVSKAAGICIDTFLSKDMEKKVEKLSPDDQNSDGSISDAGTAQIHIENCRHMNYVAINTTYLHMRRKNSFVNFTYRTPKTKWVKEKDAAGKEILRKRKLSDLANADHPDIYSIRWKAYQEMRPHGIIEAQKEHMLRLKEISELSNDKYQVDIFRREIAKCDHIIVGIQPFSESWQDQLTLFVSKYLSNYGISWVRPLVALLIANCILAALYFVFSEPDASLSSFLHVFFETLNPLTRIDHICITPPPGGTCSIEMGWPLSMLDVLHKLVYALCAYEMIRAGRRFTRLEY